jgi:hypothetical protein
MCVYVCVCVCVCVCGVFTSIGMVSKGAASLHTEGPDPRLQGLVAAVSLCACGGRWEGGRKVGSAECQCVSACVGAAVWGRRAAACTRTCACLQL